jgi:hypothetical protein
MKPLSLRESNCVRCQYFFGFSNIAIAYRFHNDKLVQIHVSRIEKSYRPAPHAPPVAVAA